MDKDLTKRDKLAALALHGILSQSQAFTAEESALRAVRVADVLSKALAAPVRE
jgi:hypothetical protein